MVSEGEREGASELEFNGSFAERERDWCEAKRQEEERERLLEFNVTHFVCSQFSVLLTQAK